MLAYLGIVWLYTCYRYHTIEFLISGVLCLTLSAVVILSITYLVHRMMYRYELVCMRVGDLRATEYMWKDYISTQSRLSYILRLLMILLCAGILFCEYPIVEPDSLQEEFVEAQTDDVHAYVANKVGVIIPRCIKHYATDPVNYNDTYMAVRCSAWAVSLCLFLALYPVDILVKIWWYRKWKKLRS